MKNDLPITVNTHTETGDNRRDHLYHLDTDLGERTNVAEQHPDGVLAMRALLDQERAAGRTRQP